MTTNLIALAKQAGAICTPVHFSRCIAEFDNQSLQAFADLIRRDEREAIAALFPQPHQEYFGAEIQDAIRARTTT